MTYYPPQHIYTGTPQKPRTRIVRSLFVGLGLILILLIGGALWLSHLETPPAEFPIATDIRIESGLPLRAITNILEDEGVVRSSFILYLHIRLLSETPLVQAGVYHFPEALAVREIASALLTGTHQTPLVRVTFPEGFAISDIRTYYPDAYTPTPETLPVAREGYLFPDTYHIELDTTEQELFTLMEDTFRARMLPYQGAIQESGMTEEEIVILASIIEREAKDTESKHRVSGILHNRLEIDMPLQVDATFDYLLDKTSAELTVDDLAVDSPFNTYKYRGLPPSPIANPGLESIEAALFPEETPYLYYLTADDGTFYYARTFDEHRINKERYLR